MNDIILELIRKYEKPGDFLYSKVDDDTVTRIESALEVQLPKQYIDYIKLFGNGGICGIEIFGVGKTGRLIVVDTNLAFREEPDPLPHNLIAIAGHEDHIDCIDCDNGHILIGDSENFKDAYECFDDYIIDCMKRAIETSR